MIKRSLFLICILFCTSLLISQNWQQKISPNLLDELAENLEVDVIILLKEQAYINTSNRDMTKEEKGEYVFANLKALSENSQSAIRDILNSGGVDYRSYHIVNAIATRLNETLIKTLAKRKDVAYISSDPWVKMAFEEPLSYDAHQATPRGNIEWGIEKIRATDAWAQGYLGEGVIVGGQDTGYEWTHPAISGKYKGAQNGDLDHNYHWHDAIHDINPLHGDTIVDPSVNPCGLDVLAPCDDHNHGTHTMGTMIGDDGGDNQIGVAPAAQWIGCRNMERGYGKPSTYIECFEWFLAPTDLNNENPDPSKSPHVIANSWSCPEFEGCDSTNWDMMELAINNLKASGVVVVVSAGNDGAYGCSSIRIPPAMFESSFAVGASDRRDTLGNFSSVGPVTSNGSGILKPNVSAPGVQVRSCVRDSSYRTWNGTSMAGPHVAGAVALMISAKPELAGQVELIESALEQTAVSIVPDTFALNNYGNCDILDQFPNNHVGYGRIDVMAAIESLLNTNIENHQIQDWAIWPTPFTENLYIQNQVGETKGLLEVVDVSGKVVYSLVLNLQDREVVKLTPPLNNGMYFYRLVQEGEILTSGKLIKQGK